MVTGQVKNTEICGIGEMWGNYFEGICRVREFGSGHQKFFRKGRDWYNSGFLEDVYTTPRI